MFRLNIALILLGFIYSCGEKGNVGKLLFDSDKKRHEETQGLQSELEKKLGFSLNEEFVEELDKIAEFPTVALMTTSGASAASIGVLLYAIAISETAEENTLTDAKKYRAYFGDNRWYQEFQKLKPKEKRARLEAMLSVLNHLKKKNGGKKLNVVIPWIEGGNGHKSAMQAIKTVMQEYPNSLFNVVDYKLDDPYRSEFSEHWNQTMKAGDADKMHRINNGLDMKTNTMFVKNIFYDNVKHDHDQILKLLDGKKPDFMLAVHDARSTSEFEKLGKMFKSELRILPTDIDYTRFFPIDFGGELIRNDLPVSEKFGIKSAWKRLKSLGRDENSVVTGMAVRREFLEYSERIANGEREALKASDNKYLDALANGYNPKKDKSYLVMLGGSPDNDWLEKYIKSIGQYADRLVDQDGKAHLFLACRDQDIEYFQKRVLEMQDNKEILGQNKLKVHVMGFLDDKQLATIMANSTNIVKPGGSTTFELLTVQAKAYLHRNLSESLNWEKNHLDWMIENNWAKKIPFTKLDDKSKDLEFIEELKRLEKLKANPYPTNLFHLDWLAQFYYHSAYRFQSLGPDDVDLEFIARMQRTLSPGIKVDDKMIKMFNSAHKPKLSDSAHVRRAFRIAGIWGTSAAFGAGIAYIVQNILKERLGNQEELDWEQTIN